MELTFHNNKNKDFNFFFDKSNYDINTFITWVKKQNLDKIQNNFYSLKDILFSVITKDFILFNNEEKVFFLNFFINLIKNEMNFKNISIHYFKEKIISIIGLIYLNDNDLNIKEKIVELIRQIIIYLINSNNENLNEIYLFLDNILIDICNNLIKDNQEQINYYNYLLILSSIYKFIQNKNNILSIIEHISNNTKDIEITNKILELIYGILITTDFTLNDNDISIISKILFSSLEFEDVNLKIIIKLFNEILKLRNDNECIVNIFNFLLSHKIYLFLDDKDYINSLLKIIKECLRNIILSNDMQDKIFYFFGKTIYPLLENIENPKDSIYDIFDSITSFSNENLISKVYEILMLLLLKFDNFSEYIKKKCIDNFGNIISKHILCLIIMKNYRISIFNELNSILFNKIQENIESLNDIYFMMLYGTLLFRENQKFNLLNFILKNYLILKNEITKNNINFILLKLYNNYSNDKEYLFSKDIISSILNNKMNFFKQLEHKIIYKIFSNKKNNVCYLDIMLNINNIISLQKMYFLFPKLINIIYQEIIIKKCQIFIGKEDESFITNFETQILDKINIENDVILLETLYNYIEQLINHKSLLNQFHIDFLIIILKKNKNIIFNNIEILSLLFTFIMEEIAIIQSIFSFPKIENNLNIIKLNFNFINLLYSIYNFNPQENFKLLIKLLDLYKIKNFPFILVSILIINIQINYENQSEKIMNNYFQLFNDNMLFNSINSLTLKEIKLIIYSIVKLVRNPIFPKKYYQNIIFLLIKLLKDFSELLEEKKKKLNEDNNNLINYFHNRNNKENKQNYFDININKNFDFDEFYEKLIPFQENNKNIYQHISLYVINYFNPYEELYLLFSYDSFFPYYQNCPQNEKNLFEILYKKYKNSILSSRKIVNIKQ